MLRNCALDETHVELALHIVFCPHKLIQRRLVILSRFFHHLTNLCEQLSNIAV